MRDDREVERGKLPMSSVKYGTAYGDYRLTFNTQFVRHITCFLFDDFVIKLLSAPSFGSIRTEDITSFA